MVVVVFFIAEEQQAKLKEEKKKAVSIFVTTADVASFSKRLYGQKCEEKLVVVFFEISEKKKERVQRRWFWGEFDETIYLLRST